MQLKVKEKSDPSDQGTAPIKIILFHFYKLIKFHKFYQNSEPTLQSVLEIKQASEDGT